ncbi:membrane protein [Mycolicibacterium cyprinidarum]|uniref:Membrane protein n=1 Tax=Mycolicibacterium cyprinidarum TaxID=2860311 RepID=A0ABQ4VCP3_9MYCO|nr:membrane protein [Mycolicibacterium sp. NGTWSNA01]GJF13895.1 membrane protein [Mycolicibacterium sp. NGTWS1803]GJF14557.1 membrane protein [Mycolicibacterium sp. NGTWS0302]
MTSPHDPRPWQRPDESDARPASASLVDPEDDIPSANYGGDFETTAIPRYDAAKPASEHPFGLISDPEPLPYVQAGSGLAAGAYGSPAAPAEVLVGDADRHGDPDRRGTQDLGLLLLRVTVGAMLIGHGLQKMFGWWGGEGLRGFREYLTDVGFRNADILSYAGAAGLIAAGLLLILGLFTPIAAGGALAYLVPALLAEMLDAHNDARLSAFLTDGHEYEVVLLCVVAAIVLIGPGRYGLDSGRGWSRRPFIGSIAALVLGVGAGVAIWVLLNGANPLG